MTAIQWGLVYLAAAPIVLPALALGLSYLAVLLVKVSGGLMVVSRGLWSIILGRPL